MRRQLPEWPQARPVSLTFEASLISSVGMSRDIHAARQSPWVTSGSLSPKPIGRTGLEIKRDVDPRQRRFTAEHGNRFEDPRRDRTTGERHPQRLVDVP